MASLSLLPLLGFTWLLQRLTRRQVEFCLFAAVGLLVSAVYLAALLGPLRSTVHVLFAIGAALAVALPLVTLRRERPAFGEMVTPGLVVFVLFALVHGWIFSDEVFYYWDELSHWGLAAKEMFAHDRLYDAGTNVYALSYPPGPALWQYFLTRNLGFSEAHVLFANTLLLVAPTQVLYQGIPWRRPLPIAVALAVQIFLLANLTLGTVSLYVDPLLAVFVGALALAHLSDEGGAGGGWFSVFPLVALTLLKENGFLLAIAFGAFVLVDGFLVRPRDGLGAAGLRRTLLPHLLLLAAPLVAWGAWQARLAMLGIESLTVGAALTPGRIADALGGGGSAEQALILERFGDAFLWLPVGRTAALAHWNEFSWPLWDRLDWDALLSAPGWLAVGLGLLAMRVGLAESGRVRLTWWGFCLAAFFAANTLLTLLLYLFVIQPDHAVKLPSYLRYVNVGVLPAVLVGFGVHLPLCAHFGRRSLAGYGGAVGLALPLLVLAALSAVERPNYAALYAPRPPSRMRSDATRLTHEVRGLLPTDARLLIAHSFRDNGFLNVLLRYELTPVRVTFGPADLGRRPHEEVTERLRAQDYVWFLTPNPDTVSPRFIPALRQAREGLLRIDVVDGDVKLQPVR